MFKSRFQLQKSSLLNKELFCFTKSANHDTIFINQNNPDYYKNSDYWRKPFDWHATSIRAILNNPVYLGKVVFGRSKTKGFFDKRRVETEEE